MKISKNWLKNYITTNKSDEKLVELFTQLGLECTFKEVKALSNDIVVGKVVSCSKHPDADRLKVCKVDIGHDEIVDIVCGAPNVSENLLVPVAKVGSKINDFKISKAKIRGVVSNGMICSGKELNLNNDNDGIMILNDKSIPGKSISEILSLENDTIFDFDITPNRGDCFSHLGISRELSIIENKEIKQAVKQLEKSDFNTSDLVTVNIKDDELCNRYACIIAKNIEVKDSPAWLKNKLLSIGQNPINNIVDLANYIMFDLGQPIHVFDYDKLEGSSINVRCAKNGEKLDCLDNINRKLNNNDIVIADSKKPVAIAGVIGGNNSRVDENTKNILIESAVFNELNIRRTAKKHDASTEASRRFERGVDSSNLVNVLNEFCSILKDLTPCKISSEHLDLYKNPKQNKKITFNIDKCNDFLGINLVNKEIEKIFFSLNISFKTQLKNYKCFIPNYRNDIVSEIDLFEEIARVYGYDNIPSNTQFSFPSEVFVEDVNLLDEKIKLILSNNGFNEHYSNSLYSSSDCKIDNKYKPVELINPLSQDMRYLRNSLLPGLLKAVSFNERRGNHFIKMFELGNINSSDLKKDNLSQQHKELMIVWMGDKIKHWKYPLYQDIYTIKGEVNNLFNMLNVENFNFTLNEKGVLDLFVMNEKIGFIKEVSKEIKDIFNLSSNVFVCSVEIDLLNKFYSLSNINYSKVNSFPSINRDIAILVDNKYLDQEIESVIYSYGGENLIDVSMFDLYKGENIPSNAISLAYSLTFKSNSKTLTDKEVDKSMQAILRQLKSQFDIIQR